jgi:hypothetical protein
MNTLVVEAVARAKTVRVTEHELFFELTDGRTISAPLVWFPRLLHATPAQRKKYELLGDGVGIHWPAVDEDLSVAGLLRGTPAPANSHLWRPRPRSGRGADQETSRRR